jgi:hypothetical protein
MQDSEKLHAVNNSMVSVHEVFGEQVFSGGFWLP